VAAAEAAAKAAAQVVRVSAVTVQTTELAVTVQPLDQAEAVV
jgi:hypothetical protein